MPAGAQPMSACPYCAGAALEGTTCPRAIECPTCHAGIGARCTRPSGHPAQDIHVDRIAAAEALDARLEDERAFFTLEDERRSSDDVHQGDQLGLLEIAPTSTFTSDYGTAPAPLSTSTLF
jgi:hypothetical protein